MAYFTKTLDNISNVSAQDYKAREKLLSKCSSALYSSNIMVATPTINRVPCSSGNISVSTLSPIQAQELDARMIAVPADESIPNHEVEVNNLYGQREQDRKVRREIANSNERRRMQSINAGFKSLKTILPHADGDKLSKAAILQQTAEYIFQLESDKLKLLNQNEKLRRACAECSSPKHRAFLTEAPDKDEGIGSPREEDLEDLRRDTIEVRQQLDKERRLRMLLEEKVRELESQLYPEKLRELANNVAFKHKQGVVKLPTEEVVAFETNVSSESITLTPLIHARDQRVAMTTVTQGPAHSSLFQTPTIVQPVAVPTSSEPVPHAGLCVTIAQSLDEETKPIFVHTKNPAPQRQRFRQPLKKRAVEIASVEPQSKVAKIALAPNTQDSNSRQSNTNASSGVMISQPTVIAQAPAILRTCSVPQTGSTTFATVPYPAGSIMASKFPQDQLLQPSSVPLPPVQCIADAQQGLVSAPQTYLTLTPPTSLHSRIAPSTVVRSTADFQIAIASASAQPPVANPLLRIQPSSSDVPPRVVPSISMTLTQLNAVPSVACTHSPQNAVAPSTPPVVGTRAHGHLLPVVAMDTVLGSRSERRISSTTTDSAVSDEDSKSELQEESTQTETNVSVSKLKRMESDPLLQSSRSAVPVVDPASIEVVISPSTPASTTTLSMLTRGPGSPPVIRHIDTAATRRNLETIVQAIDHLEQQERRNSQDQQISTEEMT